MPTKVFISWSGDLSRKLAEVIHEWLPMVLQHVKPYFSPLDIDKGKRWDTSIAAELDATSAGIICLTQDNTEAPWIMFEAGALSKKVGISRVCPVLFGLQPTDMKGPLASFQLTRFLEEEILQLVTSINECASPEIKLEAKIVDRAFPIHWPTLRDKVRPQ